MLSESSVRASIDRVRLRLLRTPADAADLDACAAELTTLGAQVTGVIEAEFSTLAEPPNAA